MSMPNAPPSSLMDSIASPNVKIVKGKGVGACSLARNTLGVEGHVGALGWDQEDCQALQVLTRTCTNTTSWLVRSWSTLVHRRATGDHGLTRLTTAWTWEKPPRSPLQYTLCLTMGPTPKCHFVPRLPSGSLKIPKVGIPTTLGAHNFVCRPPIEMNFEAKLQLSSRTFQRHMARHLHARKSGQFLSFSGREPNCQFDSQPFFLP